VNPRGFRPGLENCFEKPVLNLNFYHSVHDNLDKSWISFALKLDKLKSLVVALNNSHLNSLALEPENCPC